MSCGPDTDLCFNVQASFFCLENTYLPFEDPSSTVKEGKAALTSRSWPATLSQAALLVEEGLGLTGRPCGSAVEHKPSHRTAARGHVAEVIKGDEIGPLPLVQRDKNQVVVPDTK